MQIQSMTGSSAAMAVRNLFPLPGKGGQQVPGEGQTVPVSGCTQSHKVSSAGLSTNMLSSLLGLQEDKGVQAPDLSDMAGKMIGHLDSDGNGTVSLEEASASGAEGAADSFGVLDMDGDGMLTAEELSSALEQKGPPPGAPPGQPTGGIMRDGMNASDLASRLLEELGSDDETGLSLSQITDALGLGEETSAVSDGFSRLDGDGDGTLSLAELTSALTRYAQSALPPFGSDSASRSSTLSA